MVTAIRATVRVILVCLIIFPIGLIQSCLQWLPFPQFYIFPQWLCHGVCWALGIRLEIRGKPAGMRPTIYVANHASYLDIVVLQAVLKASFISKSEVAGWPVFGWLAKLQKSIFIDRSNRGDVKNQADQIADRLKAGGDLILFPEGTTGDGSRILPVKSSLLGAAVLAKAVQPVTVAFTHLDGLPAGRTFRYMYAWIGDESLPPHMKRIITMGDMTVRVTFHEPICDALDNRKSLASRIEQSLRAGLNAALKQSAA